MSVSSVARAGAGFVGVSGAAADPSVAAPASNSSAPAARVSSMEWAVVVLILSSPGREFVPAAPIVSSKRVFQAIGSLESFRPYSRNLPSRARKLLISRSPNAACSFTLRFDEDPRRHVMICCVIGGALAALVLVRFRHVPLVRGLLDRRASACVDASNWRLTRRIPS